MSPSEFCYWIQGFFEIADPKVLTESQTTAIKDHLALVFDKKTPGPQLSGTRPGLSNVRIC